MCAICLEEFLDGQVREEMKKEEKKKKKKRRETKIKMDIDI